VRDMELRSELLLQVLEGIPFPTAVLNADGVILAINSAFDRNCPSCPLGAKHNRWEPLTLISMEQVSASLNTNQSLHVRVQMNDLDSSAYLTSFDFQDSGRLLMLVVMPGEGILSKFRNLKGLLDVNRGNLHF
jgi:hypothetical protein